MKKSSFVALVMGSTSGLLFALGMCMALLPEWNVFKEGIIFGSVGLLLGIITFLIWCKMSHISLPKISIKNILRLIYIIIAILIFGTGMCLCLVWKQFVWGIIAGIIGIIMLFSLIPMIVGLK